MKTKRVLLWLGLLAFGFVPIVAQSNDYALAITTLYAGGATARMVKEWCDGRVPNSRETHTKALAAWREAMNMAQIETWFAAFAGERKTGVDASIENKRSDLYAQLDANSKDPASDCASLERFLKTELNLRATYPNEYALVEKTNVTATPAQTQLKPPASMPPPVVANPAPAPSNPTPTTLPNLPPFDYVAYAKTKQDPNKEPVPDQYHCYLERRGDNYATPSMALQMLPGRKYRLALGRTVSEGAFVVRDDDVVFTSGALASNEEHFYNFDRKFGASLWLNNLGSGDNTSDFRCHQRGGKEQLELLRFKRKDPQPGSYTCVPKDGSGRVAGTLEVLQKRQYRYTPRGAQNSSVGTYRADILGDHSDDYSRVDFSGGAWDDEDAFYEEDEYGQQVFAVHLKPDLECARQSAARPNAKFGPNKAPPAPGTGGLEGRYFYGRFQVAFNGYLPCGGICYDYRFFQKNGYVYTDDAEETEGTSDADCNRTYPSGFPVCETYRIEGKQIRVGTEKPVAWQRNTKGLLLGGDQFLPLEPLDGVRFNAAYRSLVVGTSSIGGGGGYSSNVDLALRNDGRFDRDASSSFFSTATDTGTPQGQTIGGASGSTSRSNTGAYRVYANTLELKYDDGRVVKLFVFAPGGRAKLDFLQIAGRKYSTK